MLLPLDTQLRQGTLSTLGRAAGPGCCFRFQRRQKGRLGGALAFAEEPPLVLFQLSATRLASPAPATFLANALALTSFTLARCSCVFGEYLVETWHEEHGHQNFYTESADGRDRHRLEHFGAASPVEGEGDKGGHGGQGDHESWA